MCKDENTEPGKGTASTLGLCKKTSHWLPNAQTTAQGTLLAVGVQVTMKATNHTDLIMPKALTVGAECFMPMQRSFYGGHPTLYSKVKKGVYAWWHDHFMLSRKKVSRKSGKGYVIYITCNAITSLYHNMNVYMPRRT